MNTIENTITDNTNYSEYKQDSDFIEWSKKGFAEAFINRNPIEQNKDGFKYGFNTGLSLRDATHKRQDDSEAYAERRFQETSDYVKWQEWKHFLEKVKA